MTTSNKNWLDFNSTNPLTAFSLFKQQSENDYNRENSYCLSRWRQYEVCTLVTVTIPGAGHLSKEPVSDQLNRLSCELYRRSSAVQLGPRSYRRMWGLAPDLPPHMWSSLERVGLHGRKYFNHVGNIPFSLSYVRRCPTSHVFQLSITKIKNSD